MTLKERWIEALRSGKYKQARGMLKKDEGFCCLGVLCDLKDSEGWSPRENANVGFRFQHGSYTRLPYSLSNEAGLSVSQMETLIEMNDVEKADFDKIATWLEERP